MPKSKLERRCTAQEFRVLPASSIIEGYAAKFNVRSEDLGGWQETISPTAFDACLATAPDVRALFNHDPNFVLGRTASGTLKVRSDSTGIFYSIDPPDTQAARDLVVSMRRGDVNQSSFAMICDEAAWEWDEKSDMALRTIMKAQLFDVSPVTYPAYPDATSGVRSLPGGIPVEVRSHLLAKRAASEAIACTCGCSQCLDGDCQDCSDPDCVAEGCTCNPDRARKPATPALLSADEVGDLRMRLRLAEIRARL